MKVLILGGSGMLGHKLAQVLGPRCETFVTFRGSEEDYRRLGIFGDSRLLGGVSVDNFETVSAAVKAVSPAVVVNCIGVVKQDAAAKDAITSINVNSLFPHRLARLCKEVDARMIHVSTDCVFSGRRGNYAEHDTPDAEDLYGRSKLLGEVSQDKALTIRTSMIGRELNGAHGLVEWFLSQDGAVVRGFKRAIFTGFTTRALAEVIWNVVEEFRELSGLWHVAAAPINKFDLLSLVKESYGLSIEIEPDETFICDRSLDGSRFRAATDFAAPGWEKMIREMRDDPTPYEQIRRVDATR